LSGGADRDLGKGSQAQANAGGGRRMGDSDIQVRLQQSVLWIRIREKKNSFESTTLVGCSGRFLSSVEVKRLPRLPPLMPFMTKKPVVKFLCV
jgi:hypothetical protein